EKFRRATSMPPIINFRNFSFDSDAGPIVQTIFVLRIRIFIAPIFLFSFILIIVLINCINIRLLRVFLVKLPHNLVGLIHFSTSLQFYLFHLLTVNRLPFHLIYLRGLYLWLLVFHHAGCTLILLLSFQDQKVLLFYDHI